MDSNNTDNNPYDDPNYSNPNFPKDSSIQSGPGAEGQNQDGQNTYSQNPYGQSQDGQGAYSQNPYGQNIGQNQDGQNTYSQNPYGQNMGQNQNSQGAYYQNPYSKNTYGANSQYSQNAYNNSYNSQNGNKRPATGMEVASLILGILSLTCCAGSGITAIIGLILIAVSKSKTGNYSGVGIGALVCCIIGLISGIIVIAVLIGSGLLYQYIDEINRVSYHASLMAINCFPCCFI